MAAIDVDAVLVGGSSLTSEGTAHFAAEASLAGGATVVAVPSVLVGPVVPVRYNVPSREVPSGRVSFDHVDLFLGDGMTRAQGVLVSDLLLRIFFNGTQLDWPLVSGVDVPDIRVAAGKVYWTEISAGFYSVRFVPNAVGPWRLLLSYEVEDQAVSLTYSAVPLACPPGAQGLQSSFVRRLP